MILLMTTKVMWSLGMVIYFLWR